MTGLTYECRSCRREIAFATGSAVPASRVRPRRWTIGWVCTTCANEIMAANAAARDARARRKAQKARQPGPGQLGFGITVNAKNEN